MNHIAYFKLQAKNLFKDYKTRTAYIDEVDGNTYFTFKSKYFDVETILEDYQHLLTECRWDESNLSLMNIQHIFANMLRFKKWADLMNASEIELELARLRFDNQDKIPLGEWEDQLIQVSRVESHKGT